MPFSRIRAAQAAWLLLAVTVSGLFAAGLPITNSVVLLKAEAIQAAGFSPAFYALYLVALSTALAFVYVAIAALLALGAADRRMGLFAAFALLLFGTVTYPSVVPHLAQTVPALQPPVIVLDQLGRALFTLFVFVFPNGRFVPSWTKWIAAVWILVQALVGLEEVGGLLADLVEQATPLIGVVYVVGLGTASWAQVYRYRTASTATEREQTRLTVGGFAIALGTFIGLAIPTVLVPALREPLPTLAVSTVTTLAMSLIPLSIGIALLRHRLFDVDALVGRALVYAALTASVVGIYMLVVGYLGSLFNTADNLLWSLLATGAVAVLFQPLRERLQRTVNRLLYGQRHEPYTVLSDLGRRLDAPSTSQAMLSIVAESIARALNVPYVAIRVPASVGAPNGLAAPEHDRAMLELASTGRPISDAVAVPLMFQGVRLGDLVLGRRSPAEGFSSHDQRLIDDLARQAGATVHAAQLATELQQSREQLVTAREEERRRLRRDLHDGLGPTLAALGLKLETARNRLADDPRADALLSDLAERTQSAVADIRRLVYALRPPALDERGLLGALQQSASSFDGLVITVEGPEDLPPLPAAVEVAAYRIAQEALTNVVRHAHAKHARVHLLMNNACLQLSVEDDGLGLSSSSPPGVGLRSMHERAAELGGQCSISSLDSGGTHVRATLPLLVEQPVLA